MSIEAIFCKKIQEEKKKNYNFMKNIFQIQTIIFKII